MPILRTVKDHPGVFLFWCDGCACAHQVWTAEAERPHKWSFNGDMAAPTFNPSLLIRMPRWEPPVTSENMEQWKEKPWPQTKVEHICHSFVKDGQIQYLDDCTHALAGKTVPLQDGDWPAFD